jgi:replicative DNA helicase
MDNTDKIKEFYLEFVPGAKVDGNFIKAPCPFCKIENKENQGIFVVSINPESFFAGYFRCTNRCRPGGFPIYYGKSMEVNTGKIPGYDPDREPFVRDVVYPNATLNSEVHKQMAMMNDQSYAHFNKFGVSKEVLVNMGIGFNGRYLVYPYYLENGKCLAAHCILPDQEDENFWQGDENFFSEEFRVYNEKEIERCEGGALFITDSEDQLLIIQELGFPAIAVPSSSDLEFIKHEQLAHINHIFLVIKNSPEARLSARTLATSLGFKVRIFKWPSQYQRDYDLCQLAKDKINEFKKIIPLLIKSSKAFSPFSSPEKEYRRLIEAIEKDTGSDYFGLESGLKKFDLAHNGIRGINIMGGQPKAGKSCFFLQVSTEIARRKTPVIYYDFENGWQKIYSRTLCRLSRLAGEDIRKKQLDEPGEERLGNAQKELKNILQYFKVVTDRKLNPDIMRKQIDFLQHETRKENVLIVIDSLHKLPFKNLSERRTGIDSWLRQMEAIRDEQNASFLVISELSRGAEGSYGEKPDMGSFKGSGDIEYSADNAMIFVPDWDAVDSISTQERKSTLWMVASRENTPGKIATYLLEYPFWGFKEL